MTNRFAYLEPELKVRSIITNFHCLVSKHCVKDVCDRSSGKIVDSVKNIPFLLRIFDCH